jgi:hypothetical protein
MIVKSTDNTNCTDFLLIHLRKLSYLCAKRKNNVSKIFNFQFSILNYMYLCSQNQNIH